jgi:hypothetical protein
MKKLLQIGFVLLMMVGITSCKEDDPALDLKLNNNDPIELSRNGMASVAIESGNGGYEVKSSDDHVATASLSQKSVTIKAGSEGKAVIIITDAQGMSAHINVTVSYKIPTEAKLLWNGQIIEFDKSGTYGIAILNNGLAVTNLRGDKKQYYLTWSGGLSEGDKSGGKMVVAQEGKKPESTDLASVKVVQTGEKGNFILLEGKGKSGWILYHD